MLKKSLVVKMLAVCAVAAVVAQADAVSMASTQVNTFNLSWQEITGATWEDASGDNIIEVGENVKFTITMDKNYWGKHDYDVMKIWLDGDVIGAPSGTSTTKLKNSDYEYIWDFNKGVAGSYNNSNYSWKSWKGADTSFTFIYAFDAVGTYDLTASVMCSADLSDIVGNMDDKPDIRDFNGWTINNSPRYQGETEKFRLSVVPRNVPEPSTISLLGFGLLSLLFIRRKK